jgi:O-antigen/teichoic acid export membrane protein
MNNFALRIKGVTAKTIKQLFSDRMRGNSVCLIISQIIMTVFGYAFWAIVAHLYSDEAVGQAGTLISAVVLLSSIGVLGLNGALVRYLPESKRKNDKINTAIWLTVGASIVMSTVYVVAISSFKSKLSFVGENPFFIAALIATVVVATVNLLLDSVLLAYCATKYSVLIYSVYSVVRVAAPFALVGLGAFGIFTSHSIGVFVVAMLGFYFIVNKLGFRLAPVIRKSIIKNMQGFSFATYVAGFLWGLPLLVAPSIVINSLGGAQAAYFYMDALVLNALMVVPFAVSQALFAAGSRSEAVNLPALLKKALLFGMGLEVTGAVLIVLLGKYLVGIFGQNYVDGGLGLLYIFAASTPLVVINMIGNSVLKIQKRMFYLIAVNALGALVTVAAFWVLVPSRGLDGLGIGYLLGQVVILIAYFLLMGRALLKKRFFSKPS